MAAYFVISNKKSGDEHQRSSIAVIDVPIHFRSIKSSYLVKQIKEQNGYNGFSLEDSFKIMGAEPGDADSAPYPVHRFTYMYPVYSSFRKKDILLLKASTGKELSGRSIFEFLSSNEYADYPVYIEEGESLIPIIGSYPQCGDLLLLVDRIKYHEPTPLYARYIVRISSYSYKYDDRTTELFTCDRFDTANHLLLQRYMYYNDLGFSSGDKPDEMSNEWNGEKLLDSVSISIIDLNTWELAHGRDGAI